MDNVNHPSHYTSSPAKCECGRTIECIDVTRHMSFNIGNAVKYLWRHQDKHNPIEDLKKAVWYIQDAIKQLEKPLFTAQQTTVERVIQSFYTQPTHDCGALWSDCECLSGLDLLVDSKLDEALGIGDS